MQMLPSFFSPDSGGDLTLNRNTQLTQSNAGGARDLQS